ncbi:probable cation-transporting ATPase 13A3 [Centruroides sculpturatus]|uniref:probable cation-transporting ATPase 13A3 n=1 Tax=Centruroides sculpturatus TaxID=218467 RepID=UPI000C6CA533|nr:probable cation-transporting ATPase 13A3 [Centruroides sculpturatus]
MGNTKSYQDKINVGEDDEMTIFGYRKSLTKTIFLYVCLILSGGTLILLLTWKPSIYLKLTHSNCPLKKADKVLLKTIHNEEYVETVIKPKDSNLLPNQDNYFYNKKIKYIWKSDVSQFYRISGLTNTLPGSSGLSCNRFYEMAKGLHDDDALYRLQLFGYNSIFVEVKPIYKLILNEIRGPFYVYQMFIVIIWMIQLYYQFAVCIVLLSVISVSATVWETRKQSKALRDAVQSQSIITVLRDGKEVCKSSHELVPGDVVILPKNSITMECDAILISGNCVVNESMLTGESIPITKIPISNDPSQIYSPLIHKRNTLFCGTEILHSRPCADQSVKAVVYRTGFNTSKGELVRAILFPKSVDFKLYRDLFKSMLALLILVWKWRT